MSNDVKTEVRVTGYEKNSLVRLRPGDILALRAKTKEIVLFRPPTEESMKKIFSINGQARIAIGEGEDACVKIGSLADQIALQQGLSWRQFFYSADYPVTAMFC